MFLTHLFFTTHGHEDESSTSVSSVTLKVLTCCTTCTVKEMFATSQRVHFISSEEKSDEGNTAGMAWQGSQVHEDPDRDASKEVSQTIPFPWERDSRTSILVPCHCDRQHAEEHAGHPKLRNNQEAEDCVHRNRATEVKVSYRECFYDLSYKHGLATWCCFRTSRGEAEKSESGNIFL